VPTFPPIHWPLPLRFIKCVLLAKLLQRAKQTLNWLCFNSNRGHAR